MALPTLIAWISFDSAANMGGQMNSATQLIKVDPNVCKAEYFHLHVLNLFIMGVSDM